MALLVGTKITCEFYALPAYLLQNTTTVVINFYHHNLLTFLLQFSSTLSKLKLEFSYLSKVNVSHYTHL